MSEFKYKFSNTEKTYTREGEKPQTYKVCDICGAEQQNNFGFEVSHARRDNTGSYRLSLCGKCANKVLPILEDALDQINGIVKAGRGL